VAGIQAEPERLATNLTRRVYAVLDGARFDDLPAALNEAGIAYRSLYRNVQDVELIRAGPWLIDPYHLPDPYLNVWGGMPGDRASEGQLDADTNAAMAELGKFNASDNASFHQSGGRADAPEQLERLAGIAGETPAAVYRIGDQNLSETALWRHVRTLNMVQIPRAFVPEAPSPANDNEGPSHEGVLFRHYDGNVLAQVLPVLDSAQFSRVFGPAKALLFSAPDHPASDGSPLRRALLPDDAAPAQPGLLSLSNNQMEGIQDARLEGSRQRTVRFLRKTATKQTQHLSDEVLMSNVVAYEQVARSYGINEERSLTRFTWLMHCSDGKFIRQPGVDEHLRSGSGTPNTRLNLFAEAMAEAAVKRTK
jgi:hypothetical protein